MLLNYDKPAQHHHPLDEIAWRLALTAGRSQARHETCLPQHLPARAQAEEVVEHALACHLAHLTLLLAGAGGFIVGLLTLGSLGQFARRLSPYSVLWRKRKNE